MLSIDVERMVVGENLPNNLVRVLSNPRTEGKTEDWIQDII